VCTARPRSCWYRVVPVGSGRQALERSPREPLWPRQGRVQVPITLRARRPDRERPHRRGGRWRGTFPLSRSSRRTAQGALPRRIPVCCAIAHARAGAGPAHGAPRRRLCPCMQGPARALPPPDQTRGGPRGATSAPHLAGIYERSRTLRGDALSRVRPRAGARSERCQPTATTKFPIKRTRTLSNETFKRTRSESRSAGGAYAPVRRSFFGLDAGRLTIRSTE